MIIHKRKMYFKELPYYWRIGRFDFSSLCYCQLKIIFNNKLWYILIGISRNLVDNRIIYNKIDQ